MPRRIQHNWVLYLHWLELYIPPKQYLLQTDKKKVLRSFFCLCGNLYNFSQFFLLPVCLLREFYAPIDRFEASKIPSHLPFGELCTNPILRSTGSSCRAPACASASQQQPCSPAGFTLPRLLSVSSIFSQNQPFLHRQGNSRVSDLW